MVRSDKSRHPSAPPLYESRVVGTLTRSPTPPLLRDNPTRRHSGGKIIHSVIDEVQKTGSWEVLREGNRGQRPGGWIVGNCPQR